MTTTTQPETTVLARAMPVDDHDAGGAMSAGAHVGGASDAGAADCDAMDAGTDDGDTDGTDDGDTPAALDSVRLHIDDLSVLAESAALWLERLPPGRNERERVAVENLVRLVERMARDLRYLWIFADETFNDVVARLERYGL